MFQLFKLPITINRAVHSITQQLTEKQSDVLNSTHEKQSKDTPLLQTT